MMEMEEKLGTLKNTKGSVGKRGTPRNLLALDTNTCVTFRICPQGRSNVAVA